MRRAFLAAAICLALGHGACGTEADRPPTCVDDGDANGPVCVERIATDGDFELVSVPGQVVQFTDRLTKYMAPVSDDRELLPPLVQNANRYRLHLDFLRAVFPDRFADLTVQVYLELVFQRATRSYYAGNLIRFDHPGLGRFYGFSAYTAARSEELLEVEEVRAIHRMLSSVVAAGELYFTFEPSDGMARSKAKNWIEPGFPIYFPDDGDVLRVEVYTAGTAYGYLRRYDLAAFEQAVRAGEIGWRDIVVIDQVPFDIEAVVGAVITGGRQWELSHVNVRMARRGTPNLYVREALDALADHDGELVRLEALRGTFGAADRYAVQRAELAEAEAWWAAHRPDAGPIVQVDPQRRDLSDLLAMGEQAEPKRLTAQFGGKAANLALLYRFLPRRHQVAGFAIPFAWFEDFMAQNTLVDRRIDPPETVSYRAYVERLAADERMVTDVAYRRALLWDLRARMRSEARLDPELVSRLVDRIADVFGGGLVKVRFRSSSNVEDALEFSGAGLYSSTSVCAADSLDADRDGPSRCDPGLEEERGIERGLRRVWASLYNDRAWEERDWYQVPQPAASMAVLVTRAFPDELANGVAFTGNPGHPDDDRYLVNAQLGDEPVVGNDPALVPEKVLLRIREGQVSLIYRQRSSVLCEPGRHVLSDEQLEQLGQVMARIVDEYPLDSGPWDRHKVLLDLEFKIDRASRELVIKQIRPFLEKCRGVICNQPPEDKCLDEHTRLAYSSFGTCDSITGSCRYSSSEVHCPNGCEQGSCLE